MTRKDYKLIASVIKTHRDNSQCSLNTMIETLCVEFKADNANFNADKFREACEL